MNPRGHFPLRTDELAPGDHAFIFPAEALKEISPTGTLLFESHGRIVHDKSFVLRNDFVVYNVRIDPCPPHQSAGQ